MKSSRRVKSVKKQRNVKRSRVSRKTSKSKVSKRKNSKTNRRKKRTKTKKKKHVMKGGADIGIIDKFKFELENKQQLTVDSVKDLTPVIKINNIAVTNIEKKTFILFIYNKLYTDSKQTTYLNKKWKISVNTQSEIMNDDIIEYNILYTTPKTVSFKYNNQEIIINDKNINVLLNIPFYKLNKI